MLNGDGNENGKKVLINKKTNFARAAHFFCTDISLPFFRNFLVTRLLTVCNNKVQHIQTTYTNNKVQHIQTTTYTKIEITCSNVIKDAVEENCESDHNS